jgi:MoxR-like ATPase
MQTVAHIREQIIKGLDEIRYQGLFLHDATLPDLKFQQDPYRHRPVYLIETLAAINVLVSNGILLFFGGHGGGKTTLAKLLGQLFFDKSEKEIEECILRGHPQLTEEKILGSLDIDQLMHPERRRDGRISVIWSQFVQSGWKIIDEVNRMSPYSQNIILSLLAEGIAKYYDQTYECGEFTLFATMNPKDEGSFELPLPFLDRFSLAIPVTMPDYESQQAIGLKDGRLNQPSLSFQGILQKDIRSIRREIDRVEIDESAKTLVDMIMEDSRLCSRTKKETNQNYHVNNGLCRSCRFCVAGSTCNKIQAPFSVRVRKDLIRYGKALAWYLGDPPLRNIHIQAIAPYAIWHRTIFNRDFLADRDIYKPKDDEKRRPIYQQPLAAAKQVVQEISNRMEKRRPLINAYRRLAAVGPANANDEMKMLREFRNDDLFIGYLFKEAARFTEPPFEPEKELEQAESVREIDAVITKFQTTYTLPEQSAWIAKAKEKSELIFDRSAKTKSFEVSPEQFQNILSTLQSEKFKRTVLDQLGDSLENMKPACDYTFRSPDRQDRIVLTLYLYGAEKNLECRITGSLTSDLYKRFASY